MIHTRGFVVKVVPPRYSIKLELEDAVSKWRAFTVLSHDQKICYALPGFEKDWADPGYFKKSEHDRKELFHHIPNIALLYDMEGIHNLCEEFAGFLKAAYKLSRAVKTYLLSNHFYEGLLPPHLRVDDLRDAIERSSRLFTLRFLNYAAGNVESKLAQDHVDKAGVSISLYSSHSGFQFDANYSGGPRNGRERNWESLDVSYPNVVVFGGYQLHKWSMNSIWPLVHQVLATTEEERQAVVAFVPLFGVDRRKKEERMQDLMDQFGY